MHNDRPSSATPFTDVLQWLGSVATEGDLRSEPRIQVQAPVTLRHAAGHANAETRDITPSGVCVFADWTPEVGEEFTLDLPGAAANQLAGQPARTSLRCVVRYCTRTGGGGSRVQIGASFIGHAD